MPAPAQVGSSEEWNPKELDLVFDICFFQFIWLRYW
jgi:hypothetical protein